MTSGRPLALKGHVVPMRADDSARHFDGVVYLADGTVAQFAEANEPAPDGFEDTPSSTAATATSSPGSWISIRTSATTRCRCGAGSRTSRSSTATSGPAGRRTAPRCRGRRGPWPTHPESLITYVQVRALAGGTTTIQGWPGTTRRPANQLVRNADDQSFGDEPDPTLTSVMTLDDAGLRRKGQQLAEGRGFIYHCAEGRFGSIVTASSTMRPTPAACART